MVESYRHPRAKDEVESKPAAGICPNVAMVKPRYCRIPERQPHADAFTSDKIRTSEDNMLALGRCGNAFARHDDGCRAVCNEQRALFTGTYRVC